MLSDQAVAAPSIGQTIDPVNGYPQPKAIASVATNKRRERSSRLFVSFRKRWRIFASAAFFSVAFMPKDMIFDVKKLNWFILRRFLRSSKPPRRGGGFAPWLVAVGP